LILRSSQHWGIGTAGDLQRWLGFEKEIPLLPSTTAVKCGMIFWLFLKITVVVVVDCYSMVVVFRFVDISHIG